MQSAVLVAAYAVLTLGACAAPIAALAQVDSSKPILVSHSYSSLELFRNSFGTVPHQPPATPQVDASLPQVLSPTIQPLAGLFEPPGILTGLGALAVTLGIKFRPRNRKRRRRRILQLRKLASI